MNHSEFNWSHNHPVMMDSVQQKVDEIPFF